ncbi:MAG: class I SAM-dependent methyltransferase [Omnitrophica WOR_2 bacterium]
MDIYEYNQKSWDRNVDRGEEFTRPVSPDTLSAARQGTWKLFLTPARPAPALWFPPLKGTDVLCLGAGGGNHGPILAAAGARVTVLDLSPRQLLQDQEIARQEALELRTVLGNMVDLSTFAENSFDLIIQPISNLFVPVIQPVWAEAYRVLREGGILMAGFMNPAFYLFDREKMDGEGILEVRHRLPYSDIEDLSQRELKRIQSRGWPLEFSHSLEKQIGGQIEAGFLITGFYEDRDARCVLDDYMPVYIATRAIKQALPA